MSLLSAQFILLSFATVALVISTRGWLRLGGFLAASAYFAFSYVGPLGMVTTLVFCLVGFGCVVGVRRYPDRLWIAVTLLTVGFVYARNYTFLEWVLPEGVRTSILATAGLSFLFFKILHVVIDTAGGSLPNLAFLHYLAYCLNFTTFLLGPIQRYQHFESQWEGREEALPARFEAYVDAVNRVLLGLVKKYVVAELLVDYALQPDSPVGTMSLGDLQISTYVFYAFLYADFSGYCDIVIGIGCLMGVRPPENFHLPFLSPNPSQYWLRVHESLTLWLTDYVFNPTFAGALRSRWLGTRPLASMGVAVFVTMLVTGLWHGTTFSFVMFGLVHGVYLIVFRTYEQVAIKTLGRPRLQALRANRVWRAASILVTFHFTATAYVFFVLDTDQLQLILERW